MEQHNRKYLTDYRPPPFYVDHIDMTIELEEPGTRTTAVLHIRRHSEAAETDAALVLDGRDIELISVEQIGRAHV